MKSLTSLVSHRTWSRIHVIASSIGSAKSVPHDTGNSIQPAALATTTATTIPPATSNVRPRREGAFGSGVGRSMNERVTRSKTSASETIAAPMTSPRPGARSRSDSSTASPSPPAPTRAAMTTMPSAMLIVWLMPVTIDGTAWGSCTLVSS